MAQGPSGAGPDEVSGRVVAAVEELVAELAPTQESRVTPSATLARLGIDSLALAELVVRLERVTGRPLPDPALAGLVTVADLIAAIDGTSHATDRQRRPAAPAPPTTAAVSARLDRPSRHARGLVRRVVGFYGLLVFFVIATVVWPLVAVLPGIERRWRLVRGASRALLGLTGTRLLVDGTDRLPAGQSYVVAANHASFLDPLVLALVTPDLPIFTAVAGLAERTPVRLFLRRMDVELVGVGGPVAAVAGVTGLADRVRAGRVVAVFPEGRRSTEPGLDPFRLGAFAVATKAGVPLVPVSIRGTRAILPVGARLPVPGRVEVEIGEPLLAPSADWAGMVALRAEARRAIQRASDEPERGVPA